MTTNFLMITTLAMIVAQCAIASAINIAGVKFDLMPALVLYAALSTSWPRTLAVAIVAGLIIDALSLGAFGLSLPPLAIAGVIINHFQKVLYRDQWPLQCVLAAGISLGCSIWTWLLLHTGPTPLAMTLDIVLKMLLMASLASLVTTPIFWLLDLIGRRLGQKPQEAGSV